MDALTSDLIEKLSPHCVARRLGLYEQDMQDEDGASYPIIHSELIELYANIFNLRE